MKKKFAVLIIVTAVVIYACQQQVSVPNNPAPDSTSALDTSGMGDFTTDKSIVCFESEVLPIFLSSCAQSGCHNAKSHKEGYVLDNYRDITRKGIRPGNPNGSELLDVIRSGEMPRKPYTKLTKTQINTIARWIYQGAKNTRGCSTCDTTLFTFSGAVQHIINTNCIGCHSTANAGGGYDFSTYAGVDAAVTNGRLWGSINHLAGYSAMPLGGAKLSDCNITQIGKWINAGAPNN